MSFQPGRVKPGQSASAESNGQRWKLEVAKVYTQVTDRQFKVDLYFTQGQSPEGVRRGQSMEVRLEVGAPSRGLVTANGPFFEETGGNWVFVLPPRGNVAQRRRVRFGRRNPEQIEVISGLAEGERIISSGYEQLRKFDRITIEPEPNQRESHSDHAQGNPQAVSRGQCGDGGARQRRPADRRRASSLRSWALRAAANRRC